MRFPDLRHVDLNLLLVLHSLLETRSTVQTGRRLNMSQPAVSRALARLRLLFDDQLLIKGGQGMIATERALSLSAPLLGVLHDLEEFLETPRFTPATATRTFRMATTDFGAISMLPNLLKTLSVEAPGCCIEVDTLSRDVFGALAAGDLDLVLIGELPVPANLHTDHIFTDDYRAAVRSGHPALARLVDGAMDLETYLDYAHVRVSIFDDRTGTDEALAHVGRQRRIAAQLSYFAVAAIVTTSTDSILTMPTRAMNRLAGPHGLTVFRPPVEIKRFSYRMVWHERTQGDFGAAWLRQKVREAAAEAG